MAYIVLVLGFILLVKSADFLVSGASALAKRFGVSDLVVGLTVVAFGTSMPELFVNVFASTGGNAQIAIGNVIGSNIFNILVILGVSSVIYPLSVSKGTVWKEIPFSLLAVLVLGAVCNDMLFDKTLLSAVGRVDGFVLLAFFIIFMYYTAAIAKEEEDLLIEAGKGGKIVASVLMVIGGIAGLGFGGKLVVDAAVSIASGLGVSQSLIGLTVVAAGTSLPELATSAVAAYKKNSDIAVGNIVGSNIFNIFFILGVSSLIRPLPIVSGINFDIIVLICASLILFFSMFTGKRRVIDRWEGVLFIIFYLLYMVFIIKRG